MSDARKNIKCSPETFEFISTIREEHDLDWDAFLQQSGEAFRQVVDDEQTESEGDLTLQDLARELDDLRTSLPEETATAVEERFR